MNVCSEMEAKTLHIMSGLVFMKQLAKGDVIYRRGQTSDRCYLVVSGLVKELSDDEEIMLQRNPEILKTVSQREALASVSNCNGNNSGMVGAEAPPGYWQCYGAGSLLGEVALITKSAHFSTMIVSGTCIAVICALKSVDRWSNRDVLLSLFLFCCWYRTDDGSHHHSSYL